jgi:beta-glucanase (GH16 family)
MHLDLDIKTLGLLVVLIMTSVACTDDVEEIANCQFPDAEDLKMVWNDEFDGEFINLEKWSYDTADGCQFGPNLCGWGNNELEYYTERPENSYIEDGKLVIKAIREVPFYLGKHRYTSARMVTKNKGDWTYGRVDVRAKLPKGQGMWPAIWMLPTDTIYGGWPQSGEIDIMENIGSEPNKVFGTIHYGHDFWRYDTQYYDVDTIDFSQDFHVYSVIWTEHCIQFQVDGNDVGVPNTRSSVLPTTYPFDQPFHLILNVAVGGNLPGNPDSSTQFPQTFEVDYVRVYQE